MRCFYNSTTQKLSKSSIKQILDDYNIEHKKSATLTLLNTQLTELNAALCMQHYVLRLWGVYSKVNDVCPFTLESIDSLEHPVEVTLKNQLNPFHFYVSTYELTSIVRYYLSSLNFTDVVTQLQLTLKQLKVIDSALVKHRIYLQSLYRTYKISTLQQNESKNIEQRAANLLQGLERSMNDDVSVLFEAMSCHQYSQRTTQTVPHCEQALTKIMNTLNELKKIDPFYASCCKIDIHDHLQRGCQDSRLKWDVLGYIKNF